MIVSLEFFDRSLQNTVNSYMQQKKQSICFVSRTDGHLLSTNSARVWWVKNYLLTSNFLESSGCLWLEPTLMPLGNDSGPSNCTPPSGATRSELMRLMESTWSCSTIEDPRRRTFCGSCWLTFKHLLMVFRMAQVQNNKRMNKANNPNTNLKRYVLRPIYEYEIEKRLCMIA